VFFLREGRGEGVGWVRLLFGRPMVLHVKLGQL